MTFSPPFQRPFPATFDRRAVASGAALPVAGMVLWLKADAITWLADGDPVAAWPDSSSNGREVTQGTAGMRPTYKTGIINSLPVLRFDGGDRLDLTSYTIPASVSMFIVFRRATAGEHTIGISNLLDDVSARYGPWWHTDNYIYTQFNVTYGTHGTPSTSTGNFILSSVKSGTSSSTVWRNGAMVGTPQEVAASSGAFTCIGFSNNVYDTSDIAEIIVYASALSDADRQAVEAYASTKYGIALD